MRLSQGVEDVRPGDALLAVRILTVRAVGVPLSVMPALTMTAFGTVQQLGGAAGTAVLGSAARTAYTAAALTALLVPRPGAAAPFSTGTPAPKTPTAVA